MKTKTTSVAPAFYPVPAWPTAWATYYNSLVHRLEAGDTRMGMLVVMLIIQGNVIAPASLLVFQYYDFGYQDYFALLACVSFFGVLVSNLGLLSVRLTINIFLTNVAIHVGLIAWHLLR